MKQQVLFFFFTLMLTGISVSAQTGGGRIAGVVIDNAGEEPLPGATIFIEELKKGIVTDGHGEFLLSDVPAATYTLTVRFIGYHTQTRKLTVGKERGKKIIIRLKAEAKSLDEVVVHWSKSSPPRRLLPAVASTSMTPSPISSTETSNVPPPILELGIVFEQEENNFELTDYIEDSLTFISFVSELENEFDIEIPDEYLLQGVLGTLNDLKNIITLLVGK